MLIKEGEKFDLEFKVDSVVYEGFMNVFHDRNPLHTNEDYARGKGYRGVVMQGNILNGFLSYFIGEKLPTKDVIIHSQEIHFKLPVYLNDTLQFNAVAEEVFESVKVVKFRFTFKNTEGKTIAKGQIQIGLT